MGNIRVNINDLNKRQTEIVTDILKSRGVTKYFVLRAGRQSGKTFLISRLSIYLCLKFANSTNAFVLAFHNQNRKVFNEMLKMIPDVLIKRALNGDGERMIEFVNGSSLQFLTASNYEAIRGSTFDSVIGDEVAMWKVGALSVIKPCVAAKRDAIFVMSSTPKGKNEFYDEAMKGMDDSNDFVKHYSMSYNDNDKYDLREIEEQRKSMPDVVFRQEYLAEFCFGKSAVFGLFSKHQTLTEWTKGKKHYFGIDNAGDGDDKTVITIMDELGRTVYVEELDDMSIPDQVSRLKEVILRYDAIGYSEYNGLGLGTSEYLQLECPGKVEKWWTSNESKQELVTNFIYELNSGNIQLPTLDLCPKLDNEMSTYSVQRLQSGKLQYSHPKGLHDDYVDSLMLANQARLKLSNGKGTEVYDPDTIQTEWNPFRPYSGYEGDY